jgi:hypothetical protein
LHVAAGSSEDPEQVSLVTEKSPGFTPLIVAEPIVRATEPVFETVTVWGALEVPTSCPGKVRLEGVVEAAENSNPELYRSSPNRASVSLSQCCS